MSDKDFYEDDESVEDMVHTFEHGVMGRTRQRLVIHMEAPMVTLDKITPDSRVWVSPDPYARWWSELPLPIIGIPGMQHELDAKITAVRIEDGVVWASCSVCATANGIRYVSAYDLGALRLSADFDSASSRTYTASPEGNRPEDFLTVLTRWRLRGATFLRADRPDPRLPLPKISWPDF
jgi:hypothetical protein